MKWARQGLVRHWQHETGVLPDHRPAIARAIAPFSKTILRGKPSHCWFQRLESKLR